VCVFVHGELDLSTADQLKDVLSDQLSDGRRVLLDLSAVSFIDSSGLAAIVNSVNGATDRGAELKVSEELNPQARRLMELTGVLPMLLVQNARSSDGAGPG
jgi:anti-anti-sigma factor